MICPYCMDQLTAGASVCKTCQRDVALVLSLQKANHDLEDRVHELEAELARWRPDAGEEVEEAAPEPPPPRPLGVADVLLIYFALPTVLLLAAHYLLIVKIDAAISLVLLRASSIVLPAIFGLILDRRSSPPWFVSLGIGAAVAAVSVLGMSTVIHLTDGDPILPHSKVAWFETLEYVASIALSYLVGMFLSRAVRPLGSRGARASGRITRFATFLARRMSRGSRGLPLEVRVQKMIKIMRIMASAATAAGAVYTGFNKIF